MTNSNEWKILFEQVANETDPQKLSKLLDRLIHALDERRQALRGAQANKAAAKAGDAES